MILETYVEGLVSHCLALCRVEVEVSSWEEWGDGIIVADVSHSGSDRFL